MKLPTESQILEAFERMYGKDLADTVRKLVGKNEINSVGAQRSESAQRQPERPVPDQSDQWWNK